jgi:hypothetical protein
MTKTLYDYRFLCSPIVPQALGMVSTYPVCESLHIVLDPSFDVIEFKVILCSEDIDLIVALGVHLCP